MIDITKIQILAQKNTTKYPKHVIVNLYPDLENFSKVLATLDELVSLQAESNIPVLTVSLGKGEDIVPDSLTAFTEKLLVKARQHKMSVNIIGKWYELKGELVEALKRLSSETKEFDHFFLNICINYDGKKEIADACRVIMRKVMAEKADIDKISPDMLKENISSSSFIPPELIIEPHRLSGTFLFDSAGAKVIFLDKKPGDIVKADIAKAIERYASS